MQLAPILIFTYKKVGPLKLAIAALKKNTLAPKSELFIFSDGGKTEADSKQINEVRRFIAKVTGFEKVTVIEAKENKGLASSIIDGVSQILETHSSVIVLEDDLVTSSNFLGYMNQALHFYETNNKVHSISGYTVPINLPDAYCYDNYFTKRASSWGWATWKDRWEIVDWEVLDYDDFVQDNAKKKRFNAMGSDMAAMLAKQMKGEISSWAIRWCYDQFKKDLYTIFPTLSKVANIGFGEQATHTKGSDNRFATPLDKTDEINFNFNPTPAVNTHFLKQFTAKYSVRTRAFYKIKNLLGL